MSDEVWKRAEIASPCVKLCTIHPETRLCLGCARSIDEIATWGRMTPEERQKIITELPEREAAPKRRRGGRKARQPD
ncbi:DUF1289 domain-containing protein [Limimaricola hongkongensis]|uniref:DUF1289 domain-containing protein n=1 Tax=Limimaricola hongkongensis DSM 17492 TaxID=1122180 RepID=A0A017HB70_9RHOB|nr:DUF1289 domain-containing protein [Limimaricola hongkongensis]EYD71611.1 hypothetical protein Lokhon_01678 [Limimaricola hongkongensis DSM 17492]